MIALAVADALERIERACSGAELLGTDAPTARATFRRLAALVHPDRLPVDAADRGHRAFARLTGMRAELDAGATASGAATLTTTRRTYELGEPIATGDLANLVEVLWREGGTEHAGVLKLARSPRNDDLIAAEAEALRILAGGDPRYAPYVPRLLDTFRHRDALGAERRANVLGRLDGFVTLAAVADAYPLGLDLRDLAWMWRRLLVAIGAAHRAGVIHAAVVPEHVLIHPDLHGLVLVDWCYAVEPGQIARALVPHRRDLYPPEVPARRPLTPAADVWLATRTIATLFDAATPEPFRRFVEGTLLAAPSGRPDDAWALLRELDALLEHALGPRRFRPFAMPERGHATVPGA